MRFEEQDFAREFREIAPQRDFEKSLKNYLERLEKLRGENEDSLVANALNPFFQKLDFETRIKLKHTGNSGIDLALLEDGEIRVIIEAKKPDSAEFPSRENLNCKAFRQGLLYLWREIRGENESGKENRGIHFVILTNFSEFYIFGARELQEKILKAPNIQRFFEDCSDKKPLAPKTNEEIYPEIDRLLERHFSGTPLRGIYVDLRDKKSRASRLRRLARHFCCKKSRRARLANAFTRSFCISWDCGGNWAKTARKATN